MAKRRQIYPETWTDDKFVSIDPLARLLFVGMWNFACDNGHLDDSLAQLKMRVLPADNCDVSELLQQLLNASMVVREGSYLKIPNLPLKQALDMRFLTLCDHCTEDPDSRFSEEDRASRNVRTTGARRAHDESPSSARRSGDGVGDGVGVGGSAPRRRSPERPIPDEWKPNAAHLCYADDHGLDLSTEAFKFRNHAIANDRRQRNWNAAFSNWLAKGKEFANERPKPKADRSHLPEAWQ